MKKNWLTIIVIFLLAANIALLLTLLLRKDISAPDSQDPFRKNKSGHFFNNRANRFDEHIAEELKFNDKQREQLGLIASGFHHEKFSVIEKIKTVKGTYLENLATESANSGLLSELADSLGTLHATLIKLDHEFYKNIKSICTAEQAHKFDSLGKVHINKVKGENCRDDGRRQKSSGKNMPQ
ncbi:MAG: hypothetical protein JXB34_08820 [Bacteroidales bacterium]|nr:hypothetical protein [Bacteroidales bacterium]